MLNVYPVITYDENKIIDISKRFAITNIDTERSKDIYFWYTIQGWKSPENIAYDFYGSCDYVWVIMALNNIIHPIQDWLLSDEELRTYVEKEYTNEEKYKGDSYGIYGIHHYEKDGIIYAPPLDRNDKGILIPSGAREVTNYEYEVAKNEKKRRIRILRPELLSTIEHEVKALFR
jgi:hypothetical protein